MMQLFGVRARDVARAFAHGRASERTSSGSRTGCSSRRRSWLSSAASCSSSSRTSTASATIGSSSRSSFTRRRSSPGSCSSGRSSGRIGKLTAESSPEPARATMRLIMLSRLDLVLLFLIVYDMTVKPEFGDAGTSVWAVAVAALAVGGLVYWRYRSRFAARRARRGRERASSRVRRALPRRTRDLRQRRGRPSPSRRTASAPGSPSSSPRARPAAAAPGSRRPARPRRG